MFRKIRENQPGPTDRQVPPPEGPGATPYPNGQDGIQRRELMARPDDRPVSTEKENSLSRLASDFTRQMLTPEQEGEARRRRRLLALRVDLHKRLLEELNLAAIEKVNPSKKLCKL